MHQSTKDDMESAGIEELEAAAEIYDRERAKLYLPKILSKFFLIWKPHTKTKSQLTIYKEYHKAVEAAELAAKAEPGSQICVLECLRICEAYEVTVPMLRAEWISFEEEEE